MILFYVSVPESVAGPAETVFRTLAEANAEARLLRLGGLKPLVEAREK